MKDFKRIALSEREFVEVSCLMWSAAAWRVNPTLTEQQIQNGMLQIIQGAKKAA
ncbi:hypothetical protein [Anatilimnocola aggregata]|nr:hypothetical protein [Anatilimnocola aggregata]